VRRERWESCRIMERDGYGMIGMMKGCKFDVLTCYRSLGGGMDRWFNEILIDLGPFPDSDDTPDGRPTVETHVNGGNFRALPIVSM
jgi:hypothetical protein